MHQIAMSPLDLRRLVPLIGETRYTQLDDSLSGVRDALGNGTVWHVNATATGGGVAEMLQFIVPYWAGAGVASQWLVLQGEATFFATTKRIHNLLHGMPGDGGDLGPAERENYEAVLAHNLAAAKEFVRPGDVVVLHDPQTAGLIPGLKEHGAHIIWRSHIGRDAPNEHTQRAWDFLRPYVDEAPTVIVSRAAYTPPSVSPEKIAVITPCIDPFSAKNLDMSPEDAVATLLRAGLISGDDPGDDVSFPRHDGSTGTMRRHAGLAVEGGPIPADARVILQVSRWDRLKDMPGVMRGFADHVTAPDAHLVLCGPDVIGVTDDPEGAEVLQECREVWGALPEAVRSRIHLVCLPMDDTEENAHMVNALQRHAYTVVQKSLFEGFGLTVTEAMWKGRPVVASGIGGILDQIADGRDGLLVADPPDTDALGAHLNTLLADPELAQRLGESARHRVLVEFLGDTNMMKYANIFRTALSHG